MKLLKWLLKITKPSLNKPVINNNLSFKEKMKQDIIPKAWRMVKKEKEHLNWLVNNNASKDIIETSQYHLNRLRQRHKEYIKYVENLS